MTLHDLVGLQSDRTRRLAEGAAEAMSFRVEDEPMIGALDLIAFKPLAQAQGSESVWADAGKARQSAVGAPEDQDTLPADGLIHQALVKVFAPSGRVPAVLQVH